MAFVFSSNHNLVQNNVYLGSNAGPTLNMEWVYSQKFNYGIWAFNFGRRMRSKGETINPLIPPMEDSWIYSLAYSHYFSNRDLKLIAELYGSFPVKEDTGASQGQLSHSEGLFAMKYDHKQNLSFLSGLGAEVSRGSATPDWRFFVGVNYNFCTNCKAEMYRTTPAPENSNDDYAEDDYDIDPDFDPEAEYEEDNQEGDADYTDEDDQEENEGRNRRVCNQRNCSSTCSQKRKNLKLF